MDGNLKITVAAAIVPVIVAGDPYAYLEVEPYVEYGQTWTANKNISASTTVEHQDLIVA